MTDARFWTLVSTDVSVTEKRGVIVRISRSNSTRSMPA